MDRLAENTAKRKNREHSGSKDRNKRRRMRRFSSKRNNLDLHTRPILFDEPVRSYGEDP